ncbi:MAG TPA: ring-cleaving dioxygenase [Thermomicrobiales bacterium]|nr:ring-cleaving dioxygenase [Thermomicrobiales bacterium]
MEYRLGGLHHVSAITGDAGRNIDFFTRILGMRLVKKTVNQDDVSTYHFFYGDELGRPGTEVTFFAFPGANVHRPGSGTITTIALAVPSRESLDWWQQRFDELNVEHGDVIDRGGRPTLPFVDFEGQRLALVAVEDRDRGAIGGLPWDGSPIPAEHQIRGMYFIETTVADLEPTARTLTDTLRFEQADSYEIAVDGGETATVTVFQTGPGGAGAELHVVERPGLPLGRPGAGGVHHVAFRTPDDEQHAAWQQHIQAAGFNVTPQIDRFYFRAIYFREPGRVLYEISTDGPGFATDEDPAHLGEKLALPPFLEPYREQIEAGLQPIVIPSPQGTAA